MEKLVAMEGYEDFVDTGVHWVVSRRNLERVFKILANYLFTERLLVKIT